MKGMSLTSPNRKTRRAAARLLGASAVGSLAVGLLPGAAIAVEPDPPDAIEIDEVCVNVPDDASTFNDDGGIFETSIECLNFGGVANGTTETTFEPGEPVTRAQMASFIARSMDLVATLEVTDGSIEPLPAYDDTNDAFTDVDDNDTHVASINRLEAAGIVLGTSAGVYNPGGNVTRGQMASFINRAQLFLAGEGYASTENYFTDDEGSVHEANINGIASEGILEGDGVDAATPNGNVTRAQMAGFLARHLAANEAAGAISPIVATSPADGAVAVTPVASATQADGEARSYSVDLAEDDGTVYGGNVIIRLLDANADGTPNGTIPALVANVTVQSVDGGAPAPAGTIVNGFSTFAGIDGQVSFIVRDATDGAASDAVPQVIRDADGDNVVDEGEETGLGGAVFFTAVPVAPAAEAPSAPTYSVVVQSVNKAEDSFVVADIDPGAGVLPATFEYDATDLFTGASTTFAEFEDELSATDAITIAPYSNADAGQSTFNVTTDNVVALTVAPPTTPVDAATATLTGVGNPGFTVAAYRDVNPDALLVPDDDYQPATDPLLTSGTIGDDGTYTLTVPLLQNVANNFVVVQRVTGASTSSAPAVAVRDTEGEIVITDATPAPAAAPTITAAAAVQAAPGAAGQLAPADVITLTFSELLTAPGAGDAITVQDADGTIATVTCGTEATCAVGAGNTITLTLNVFPTVTTTGGTAGVSNPAQINIITGFTAADDAAPVNLADSADRIIEGF